MTMITTTYPLAGLETQQQQTTVAGRRPWGFWATLGWLGVAFVTHFVASNVCGLGYVIWSAIAHPDVAITFDSPTIAHLTTAVAMPAAALVLMLIAWRRGPIADYIGLTLPKRRDVFIGLTAVAVLWGLSLAMFELFPAYNQVPELVRGYRALLDNPTALVLFWLTLVVTAPVAEEIMFRGFLMRGWGASRLGVIGAVPLTATAFAVVHLQYNLPTMFMVFSLGLLLGVMRWRSGSTTLTIMMHASWNLACGVYFAMQA